MSGLRHQLDKWHLFRVPTLYGESYRRDSNHQRLSVVISPPKTQTLVLIDPALVVLRCDWRSFVQHAFHVQLRNGWRELAALAER